MLKYQKTKIKKEFISNDEVFIKKEDISWFYFQFRDSACIQGFIFWSMLLVQDNWIKNNTICHLT